jgi:hypothetical protein
VLQSIFAEPAVLGSQKAGASGLKNEEQEEERKKRSKALNVL